MDKKCSDCVYSIHVDHGYSNWTVEGTYLHCAKKLNPAMPYDRFYGEDDRCKFASECSSLTAGDGVFIDVDGDGCNYNEKTLDEVWSSYMNGYVSGDEI